MPPAAYQFPRKQDSAQVTILNGASLSDAAPLYGTFPVAIITPAVWTAADMTFAVSYDNGVSYVALYSQSAEVKIASAILAVGDARCFALDPTNFHGVTHLKVRSGVNGTTVNQGADRVLQVVRAFRLS